MSRVLRKIIQIKASDSPNVALGLKQQAMGEEPTGEVLVPGVLTWNEYMERMKTWTEHEKIVGVHAEFDDSPDKRMFPPAWLIESNKAAKRLKDTNQQLRAKALGIDPAEGGDDTCFSVVNPIALIKLVSKKTPDTSDIPNEVIALSKAYAISHEFIMFDRGGGGHQHACELRKRGYDVKTVGFGESAAPEQVPWMKGFDEKVHHREEQFVYKNRRAQMYHQLRLKLDPARGDSIFAIPEEYNELLRQMALIPLQYNEEGGIWLPPKRKRDSSDTRLTLTEMLGRSPDELDSLVVAVYAMAQPSVGLGTMF